MVRDVLESGSCSDSRAYLSTDRARTNTSCSHLDDLPTDMIGQWPSIDEDTTELIDTAMTG